MISVDEINMCLAHTVVVRFEFVVDVRNGVVSIELELVDHGLTPRRRIVIVGEDAAELRFRAFGPGIREWELAVRDVSELQHDRVVYVLEDIEDDNFFVKLRGIQVKQLAP